jgi:hypothetical protein
MPQFISIFYLEINKLHFLPTNATAMHTNPKARIVMPQFISIFYLEINKLHFLHTNPNARIVMLKHFLFILPINNQTPSPAH